MMSEEIPLILVTVGTTNYAFNSLMHSIQKDPIYKSEECQWVIQCGTAIITDPPRFGDIYPMLPHDELESMVKNASLVISHAGIGSIYLMLKYDKKGIIVPRLKSRREHMDDHQLQIASAISSDKIRVVSQEDEFPRLSLQSLREFTNNSTPVDIVNPRFAKKLKEELMG